MRRLRGIYALLLLGLAPLGVFSQTYVPKDLEGWQSWVLQDKPFLRCPFFANTAGTDKDSRLCALPGRLTLELTQSGGRFAQSWQTFTDGWIPLPGNFDNWPSSVAVNNTPAAVVSRDGIAQIYVGAGTFNVTGRFTWSRRPESLAVPAQDGMISLTVDGQPIEPLDRADDALWLGKRRDTAAAKQMDVQVYRLLTDGIPLMLETRVELRVTGDPREEILNGVIPSGFAAVALNSPLPARLAPDGSLKIQARAGSWTVQVNLRATDNPGKVSLAPAQGAWPRQEIWSYQGDDRLRVAGIEGAASVDPSQSNVPQDWRAYPSYRVETGGELRIVEHSRGPLEQNSNHLSLRRDLYLDFSHRGFTVVDNIQGQMRTNWRLDMRHPFTLAHAKLGPDNLLVTHGAGELTGVEIRSPNVNLSTLARIDASGGRLPATGWNERFDQVSGTLTLPPGHRLLAALNADQAPESWIERWTLMDIFLVVLTCAVAFRLFGMRFGAITLIGLVLAQQEDATLVWLVLMAFATLVLFKQLPEGRFRQVARWVNYAAMAILLIQLVPFGVEQVRFAFYPQLADQGTAAMSSVRQFNKKNDAARPQPAYPKAAASSAMGSPEPLNEMVVTGALRSVPMMTPLDNIAGKERERYAPGALLQAGPGIPQWHYVRYSYGWTGPVEAAQSVRFLILGPALLAVWRILGVALLMAIFWRMTRGNAELKTWWRRLTPARALLLPLLVTALCSGALVSNTEAADTPDKSLLDELAHRLTQPSPCVPNCAETMNAHVAIEANSVALDLNIAALANVAVALPTLGQRTDLSSISVDGSAVSGAYSDANQQLWLTLKPGVHLVKINARLASVDAVALLFPQVPRTVSVTAQGWEVAGVAAGKLLGNTLQLTRRQTGEHGGTASQNADRFAPYVRVVREFNLGLDWSMVTRVERIAPEHGGFTLEIPLLSGESVLTGGIDTDGGARVPASFDTDATEFTWESALTPVDSFELSAPADKPWNEVWTFKVSPMWRATFGGTPAVLPATVQPNDWVYEYYPRAGEHLRVSVSRPVAVAGNTLAIDAVEQSIRVGKRSSDSRLQFTYRSTQGNQHAIQLPPGARLTAVNVDGRAMPLRAEQGQLQLALMPGTHRVQVDWQSEEADGLVVRSPPVNLAVASSNVTTTLEVGQRWVLFAGGHGIGPAILYWGELAVFALLAIMLGRSRSTPLPTHQWLLLGLGLSTFSWSVMLLAVVWMMAMRWRERVSIEGLGRSTFNALQVLLIALTLIAVFGLITAIPYGLLASPDMRIAGAGQFMGNLSWFTDQAANQLPSAWVVSVSLWWYKAAMLAWALWLAFALTRWLPYAWRALNAGSLWSRRPAQPPTNLPA